MSEFEFTPAERKYIESSEVYTRFSTVKFSSLTVATIVTALNAITPSPENAPVIKWLIFLIRTLSVNADGSQKVGALIPDGVPVYFVFADTEQEVLAANSYFRVLCVTALAANTVVKLYGAAGGSANYWYLDKQATQYLSLPNPSIDMTYGKLYAICTGAGQSALISVQKYKFGVF